MEAKEGVLIGDIAEDGPADKTERYREKTGAPRMNLRRWDPLTELQQLRENTDRLWDAFLNKLTQTEAEGETIAFLPDVDLVEAPDEYRLYLAMPGVLEEDIDLTISPRTLIVRGERQPPYDPGHSRPRLGEWRYGFFARRFHFAFPVRTDAVRADYDAGVLTVILPKDAGR